MLATAGAALVAFQAQANSTLGYNVSGGDLLLDFRPTGGGSYDVTIDLGNYSTMISSAVGGVVNLNSWVPVVTGVEGSLSSLNWSVGGQDNQLGGDVWATRTAPGNVAGTSTPWLNESAAQNAAADVAIESTGANGVTHGTTLVAGAARTSDGSAYSYAHFTGSGNWGGHFQGNTENATGVGFTGSAISVEDLYFDDQNATGGTPATYLGSFVLGGDGTLSFDVASSPVVPEPMTYGLLSGLGLLAVSLRQQIRRLRA